MRLREIHVKALPGIHSPFSLPDLGGAVNVLIGPNASGKSSVVRAIRAVLYPSESKGDAVHVAARWSDEGDELEVERLGDAVRWFRNGVECDVPPTLPSPDELGGYLLRIEDLVRWTEGDEAIAARITTALAGGFDLPAVREAYHLKSNHGHAEKEAFRDARRRRLEATTALADLAQEERRLEAMAGEREEARRRAEDAGPVQSAMRLVHERRRRRNLEERLDSFPDGMDRLKGHEVEWLETARRKRRAAEDDLQEARDRASDGARRAAATGLTDGAPSAVEVRDRLRQTEELAEAEAALARAEKESAQAEAALADLLRSAEPDDGPSSRGDDPDRIDADLSWEGLAAVARALEARDASTGRVEALDRRILRLRSELGDEPRSAGSLRLPRKLLADWLAAPDPRAGRTSRRTGALAAFTVALAAVIAAAVLVAGGPEELAAPGPLLLLLGSGIAYVVGAVLSRPPSDPRVDTRAATEREYVGCAAEAPAAWTVEAVRDRYEELTRAALGLEQEVERYGHGRERLRKLRLERDEAAREADAARARFLGACEEARLPAHRVDAGLLDRLAWLHAVRLRRAEAAARRAEVDRLRDAVVGIRADVLSALARTGDAPEGEASAARIRMRLEELNRRIQERAAAEETMELAARAEARAAEEVADADATLAGLFDACGIPLEAGAGDAAEGAAVRRLMDRAERLEGWRELDRARSEASVLVAALEAELAGRPDLSALADREDEAELERRAEGAEAARVLKDELITRIAETGERLRAARRARNLERARREETRAEDALTAALDEALSAEAGRFLVDRIEREHRTAIEPRALARARTWFGRFTHHAFSLEFDPSRADGDRFLARDRRVDRERSLDELSTGTKAQLLLAVRVAHAAEAERGRAALPLFLDEALTTTDAERFTTIANALCTLAREEGRQVFYLSARRADGALWEAIARDGDRGPSAGAAPEEAGAPRRATGDAEEPFVRIVDVAAARRLSWAPPTADAFALPAAPPHVEADPDEPERFAAALGVAPLDAWAPEGVHPFHLLRDRLPLVSRLARLNVTSLGSLRALLDDPRHAASVLAEDERRLLSARASSAEAWCRAWRAARPRPLSEAALVDCDAVTDTFRERIVELVGRVEGDASALLSELEARAVPNFGPARIEPLKAWLEERHYLMGDAPSGGPDPVVVVASTLRGTSFEDALDEAERLARWLEAGVPREGVRPPARP